MNSITMNDGVTGDNVTPTTYQGFVAIKAKPGQDILATMTPEKCHLLHMAVGVSGEVAELVDSGGGNWKEECGDIEFFLQGLTLNASGIGCYAYTPGLTSKYGDTVDLILDNIVVEAGGLLDVIKKHTIYNKPLDIHKANEHWYQIHSYLDTLYSRYNTDRQAILSANVDKLNKRYKAGYSDQEAQQRADKPAGE